MDEFVQISFSKITSNSQELNEIAIDIWSTIIELLKMQIKNQHGVEVINYFLSLCGDDIECDDTVMTIPMKEYGGQELSSALSTHWIIIFVNNNLLEINKHINPLGYKIINNIPNPTDISFKSYSFFIRDNHYYGVNDENSLIKDADIEEIEAPFNSHSCSCELCKNTV